MIQVNPNTPKRNHCYEKVERGSSFWLIPPRAFRNSDRFYKLQEELFDSLGIRLVRSTK